jgi:ferredoxin-type protein NapF
MAMRTRRDFLLGRAAPRATACARIGDGCLEAVGITCRACGDACLPRAIRFLPQAGGISTVAIDEPRCTGCGDCAAVCPANAITLEGIPA